MKRGIMLMIIILWAFSLMPYKVYLWIDDAGLQFFDPDKNRYVYCWENLAEALDSIPGIEYVRGTSLPPADELDSLYDAVMIVCGWRNDSIMSSVDKHIIYDYLVNYHGKVYVEGNNFVEVMTRDDPAFLKLFGLVLVYEGDARYNVDTLAGAPNTVLDGWNGLYIYGDDPDISVDAIAIDSTLLANGEGEGWDILIQPLKGKAYYSRANAYAEYDLDKKGERKFIRNPISYRTYVQSVVSGAIRPFEARKKYVEKILEYLGNINVLIVNDNREDTTGLSVYTGIMDYLGYPYDVYTVPAGSDGPDYSILMKYNTVIWYTGHEDYLTFTDVDQSNIVHYLIDKGGNMIVSSPQGPIEVGVADSFKITGNENEFLVMLGVDYIGYEDDHPFYLYGVAGNFLYPWTSVGDMYYEPYLYSREAFIDTIEGSKILLINRNTETTRGISYVNTEYGYRDVFYTIALELDYHYVKFTHEQADLFTYTFTDFFGYPILSDEVGLSMENNDFNNREFPDNKEEGFTVYSHDKTLFITSVKEGKVQLFDVTGRKILEENIVKGRNVIGTGLGAGIYYLKFNGEIKKIAILP